MAINLPGPIFEAAMDRMWEKSHYARTGFHTQSTLASKTPDVRKCGFTVFKGRATQDIRPLNPACSNRVALAALVVSVPFSFSLLPQGMSPALPRSCESGAFVRQPTAPR